MVRTKQIVKVPFSGKNGVYYEDREMTCIDGLGVMQDKGNKVFSVTLTKGNGIGLNIALAPTFCDAADFARTLMQNYPNFYDLVEEGKGVVDACRTIQFMLAVHFGTCVELPFGNFNSNLKN